MLRAHCADVGRDPDEIRMTWSPEVFIRATEAEVAGRRVAQPVGRAGRRAGGPATSSARRSRSPRRSQAYVDLGCRGFIPWCADYPDTETLELFATEVVPNFR